MQATRTLGKYTLVRHLATGGMAEIWLAHQEGPGGFNKELVIKQILPHLAQDDQFSKMFLDEARLAAQLHHPKIAQIFEFGEEAGKFFIAMEFIDGMDLCDLISAGAEKNQPIPVNIAAKIIMDVLEALDYAHDFTSRDGEPYNLVHRDVTPHNVIVSNDGIVKLVDFGVAKAKANQSKTQTGAVKGKYAYMAPEQIQSKEIDRRVDIFAAGILLYEIITGVKPFGDDLEAISNILTQPTPDARAVRADVPEAIVAVIQKATAKDPNARYSDAHEMLRDVEVWLRTDAEYVGDREVSAYIRKIQGMATLRHTGMVQPTPGKPDSTPIPGPVHTPVPTQTGTPAPGPIVLRDRTEDELVNPLNVTGEMSSVVNDPSARTDTETIDTDYVAQPPKSNTGLIVVFVILFLAVVGVAGAVAYFGVVSSKDEKDEKDEKVVKVEKPVDPPTTPTIPHEFQHANGFNVTISTRPVSVEVFFKGKTVGNSPVQTKLRPGEYEVELATKKGRVKKSFKVEAGKPIQRVKFEL